MKTHIIQCGLKQFTSSLTALVLTATAAISNNLCVEDKGTPQFDPANHLTCSELWPEAKRPSVNADGTPKPLNVYEAQIGKFMNLLCYRDPQLTGEYGEGWGVDKRVRDTGPYVAHRNDDNKWVGEYHGFHAPVVIWYSPEAMDWIRTNRAEGFDPKDAVDMPDGAIIIKEMYTAPASRCDNVDVRNLAPDNVGIAYMVRDSAASWDGWFWGYFGMYDPSDPNPNIDWPVAPSRQNGAAYAGFGQYCVNCHASAINNSTFSSLANIEGEPGEPLVFLSMDWFLTSHESDEPDHVPAPSAKLESIPQSTPLGKPLGTFADYFNLPPGQSPRSVAEITLPSQTYDNVWAEAAMGDDHPPLSSEYITSDQCAGCHASGGTGLRFDMTIPNPHGDNLISTSPYSTWRTSPMGLAGRDPIFFAQLSSEENFHDGSLDLIWNTCFGCHGMMGQRQLQLDKAMDGVTCNSSDGTFTPDMVTAVPWPGAQTKDMEAIHYDPEAAKYGALARDGISCVGCHRMVLTPEQEAEFQPQEQNVCVEARQDLLNVSNGNLEGFAKTFTGSFLVADPGTIWGPFDEPKPKPMQHALGITPEFDTAIASSEQCGTCHTVHLPVLWQPEGSEPKIIADTYEQATYPEWLFSKFRTGNAAFLPEGELLPHGAGETPVTCAECHMESHSKDGEPFVSRIAEIQERSNMPEADHTLPAEDIDLENRSGFARHTLVGLNLFLVKMAQQFPEILGIPLMDPMLASKGMAPLQRTEQAMVDNAKHKTADIDIVQRNILGDELVVQVRVDNKTGHKFPSGVSFRRAFLEFEVFDESGQVLWHSGKTNELGVIVSPDSGDPLKGELWYDNQCTKTATPDWYQPHYQEITNEGQVQIYQEVKLNPGDQMNPPAEQPVCFEHSPVAEGANLTTSFLSICHTAKDNRLLPPGLLPYQARVDIANKLGMTGETIAGGETQAEMLARESGAHDLEDDPDYFNGGNGGDTITYRIPLSDMDFAPKSVRATLHYQATPPFYLQDRFCTGSGSNRDRLYHLSSLLDTADTPIENWSFELVSTQRVPINQ